MGFKLTVPGCRGGVVERWRGSSAGIYVEGEDDVGGEGKRGRENELEEGQDGRERYSRESLRNRDWERAAI